MIMQSTVSAVIPLPLDYNIDHNFQFLRRSPREVLHVLEGDVVYKLFYLNGGNLLVRITPDTNTFVVEVINRLPT
jgi:hypothetical protein